MTSAPGKMTCESCSRTLNANQFVKYRDGRRCEVCIDCLCTGVDNTDMRTFLHILRHFDVPFRGNLWARYSNTAFTKNPMGFGPTSVVGKYIRVMHMKQYSNMHYLDSDRDALAIPDSQIRRPANLTDAWGPLESLDDLHDPLPPPPFEDAEETTAYADRARKRIESDADRKDRGATVARLVEQGMDPLSAAAAVGPDSGTKPRTSSVDEDGTIHRPPRKPKAAQTDDTSPSTLGPSAAVDVGAVPGLLMQMNSARSNDEAVMNTLTPEDQQYLIAKWGAYYTPSQWLRMERMYNEYAQEYELSVDRAETLRKICATSVKMDEALEQGDVNSYRALAGVFDQQRKSANFTEQQNKESRQRPLDTVGEMIAMCEREEGPIPQWANPDEYPKDKIDQTIRDYKMYVSNLVRNEMGLGAIIESFVAKLEESEREREKDRMGGVYDALDADDRAAIEQNAMRQYLDHGIEAEAEEILRKAEGGV